MIKNLANMETLGRRHYQIVAGLEAELKKLLAARGKAQRKLARAQAYAEKRQDGSSPMGADALIRQAMNELAGLDDRIAFLRRQLEGMGVKTR